MFTHDFAYWMCVAFVLFVVRRSSFKKFAPIADHIQLHHSFIAAATEDSRKETKKNRPTKIGFFLRAFSQTWSQTASQWRANKDDQIVSCLFTSLASVLLWLLRLLLLSSPPNKWPNCNGSIATDRNSYFNFCFSSASPLVHVPFMLVRLCVRRSKHVSVCECSDSGQGWMTCTLCWWW